MSATIPRVLLVRGACARLKWLKIDGDAQTLPRALRKSLDEAAA
jgi:hypothetical protein